MMRSSTTVLLKKPLCMSNLLSVVLPLLVLGLWPSLVCAGIYPSRLFQMTASDGDGMTSDGDGMISDGDDLLHQRVIDECGHRTYNLLMQYRRQDDQYSGANEWSNDEVAAALLNEACTKAMGGLCSQAGMRVNNAEPKIVVADLYHKLHIRKSPSSWAEASVSLARLNEMASCGAYFELALYQSKFKLIDGSDEEMEAAKEFAEQLANATVELCLIISGGDNNNISEELSKVLASALRKNKSVTSLWLSLPNENARTVKMFLGAILKNADMPLKILRLTEPMLNNVIIKKKIAKLIDARKNLNVDHSPYLRI